MTVRSIVVGTLVAFALVSAGGLAHRSTHGSISVAAAGRGAQDGKPPLRFGRVASVEGRPAALSLAARIAGGKRIDRERTAVSVLAGRRPDAGGAPHTAEAPDHDPSPTPASRDFLPLSALLLMAGAVISLGRQEQRPEDGVDEGGISKVVVGPVEGSPVSAEEALGQILATSPALAFTVALRDGRVGMRWISENVSRLLGYSVDEALRADLWSGCVHPDERGEVVRSIGQFLADAEPGSRLTLEHRLSHRDGRYRWFRTDLHLVERAGSGREALGASLDITTEREAVQALAAAEAQHRDLVETAPHGIVTVDVKGRIIEANAAAAEILGRGVDDLIGRDSFALITPATVSVLLRALERQRADPTRRAEYEVSIIRQSGEERLVNVRSGPIVGETGTVGFRAFVSDITEERRRAARVGVHGAALENLGHGVAISDADGQLVYVNGAFMQILGFEDDTPLPSLDDFLPDEAARLQLVEINEALRATGRWTGRVWRRRSSDRRVIPIDTVLGLVPASDGGKPNTLTICSDASEAVEHEQHLRRVERLSSLGTLVGGVAHELNNPLNAIINFAALLMDESRATQEQEDLKTIVREGKRAAKIVSSLRSIAREVDTQDAVKEAIDVNDIVLHVLKLRSYSLSTSSITINSQLGNLVPLAWGDRGQIEQVVFNLVVNAEQAMIGHRGKGRLQVRTRAIPQGVSIEVTDDGPGIPSDHLARIFDPFWTTKAPGDGTGLGLSHVHNIVTEHAGRVRVHSEPGSGTTFVVELPRAAEAGAASAEMTAPALNPDQLRILVVDDEPGVRRSLARYLQRAGHHVDEASEGRQALQKLGESAPYDVILSDLKMPGMGGQQLYTTLLEGGQGLERKVIIMTGGTTGNELSHFSPDTPILLKPVDFAAVSAAIRKHVAR